MKYHPQWSEGPKRAVVTWEPQLPPLLYRDMLYRWLNKRATLYHEQFKAQYADIFNLMDNVKADAMQLKINRLPPVWN